ncbi:MAG: hypothetical protein ABMA02_17275 [Saprospiraceae bacterium]
MLRSSSPIFIRLASVAAAVFFATNLLAQSAPTELKVAAGAVFYDNKAIVRWAPANHDTWAWGNEHGYDLVRYTIVFDGDTLDTEEYETSMTVLGTALKPLPENDWEPLAANNNLAGVAAGTIYGDSLEFLPPGGATLTNVYNKSQERENRFTFSLFAADQDLSVAQNMGLAFVDNTDFFSHSVYAYFIRPHEPDSGMVITPGFAMINTDSIFALPAPKGLSALAADSSTVLNWQRDDSRFTSYDVERSTDGVNFVKQNEYPLLAAAPNENDNGSTAYPDSLANNTTTYIYRVRGRSPYGLISPPSDTVHVKGKPDPIFALLSVGEIVEAQEGELTVNWNFPQDMEAKIQGFDVYRGAAMHGPFAKINQNLLSVTLRAFTDTDPDPVNYYQVRALDENGYTLACFPQLGQLRDDTPPAAPTGLIGTSDPSGVVTLRWSKNTEADVMGYRVFTANSANGDYAQVTSVWINDTAYLYEINLNTLSENAWFRVAALDYHQNRSTMSEPAQVARPDIIPPSAPIITSVQPTTQGVAFEWRTSTSSDVVRHEFQRKTAGLPGWTALVQFNQQYPLPGYLDTTADKRRWYQYRLVAFDEAGNQGGSRIAQAKPINDGLRDAVLNFNAQPYTGGGTNMQSIHVTWNYPAGDPDLIGFQVFRAYDSSAMFSYRFFPIPLPTSSDYADMTASVNGNLLHCLFTDLDIAFTEHPVTAFTYVHSAAMNQNLALPAPPNNPLPGSSQVYTLPNPAPNKPAELRYWVMAKFADGSYSPLAGPVAVQL